jgi:hypothetical protein
MLIGLDGANPHLIARYISEGKRREYRRIFDAGCAAHDYAAELSDASYQRMVEYAWYNLFLEPYIR